MYENIAKNVIFLKKYRKEKLETLAEAAGITRERLSMFLNQRNQKSISLHALMGLCEFFDVPINRMIECSTDELLKSENDKIKNEFVDRFHRFIDHYLLPADDDFKSWFLVQFRRSFPDFVEFERINPIKKVGGGGG